MPQPPPEDPPRENIMASISSITTRSATSISDFPLEGRPERDREWVEPPLYSSLSTFSVLGLRAGRGDHAGVVQGLADAEVVDVALTHLHAVHEDGRKQDLALLQPLYHLWI